MQGKIGHGGSIQIIIHDYKKKQKKQKQILLNMFNQSTDFAVIIWIFTFRA
jgi:hypothetical protein